MRPISISRITNKLLTELIFAALIVVTVPVVCYVALTGQLPIMRGDFPPNNAPSQI